MCAGRCRPTKRCVLPAPGQIALHVVNADCPGLIQHHQSPVRQHWFGLQQTLQRHRLKSFFAENIRAAAVGAQKKAVNTGFLAGGDQFAQCRGFSRARQTAQAGDAVAVRSTW